MQNDNIRSLELNQQKIKEEITEKVKKLKERLDGFKLDDNKLIENNIKEYIKYAGEIEEIKKKIKEGNENKIDINKKYSICKKLKKTFLDNIREKYSSLITFWHETELKEKLGEYLKLSKMISNKGKKLNSYENKKKQPIGSFFVEFTYQEKQVLDTVDVEYQHVTKAANKICETYLNIQQALKVIGSNNFKFICKKMDKKTCTTFDCYNYLFTLAGDQKQYTKEFKENLQKALETKLSSPEKLENKEKELEDKEKELEDEKKKLEENDKGKNTKQLSAKIKKIKKEQWWIATLSNLISDNDEIKNKAKSELETRRKELEDMLITREEWGLKNESKKLLNEITEIKKILRMDDKQKEKKLLGLLNKQSKIDDENREKKVKDNEDFKNYLINNDKFKFWIQKIDKEIDIVKEIKRDNISEFLNDELGEHNCSVPMIGLNIKEKITKILNDKLATPQKETSPLDLIKKGIFQLMSKALKVNIHNQGNQGNQGDIEKELKKYIDGNENIIQLEIYEYLEQLDKHKLKFDDLKVFLSGDNKKIYLDLIDDIKAFSNKMEKIRSGLLTGYINPLKSSLSDLELLKKNNKLTNHEYNYEEMKRVLNIDIQNLTLLCARLKECFEECNKMNKLVLDAPAKNVEWSQKLIDHIVEKYELLELCNKKLEALKLKCEILKEINNNKKVKVEELTETEELKKVIGSLFVMEYKPQQGQEQQNP